MSRYLLSARLMVWTLGITSAVSVSLQGASPTPSELGARQQESVDKIQSVKVKAIGRIEFEGTDPIERQTLTIMKGTTVRIQEGIVGQQVVDRVSESTRSRVVQRVWSGGKLKFSAVINPANSNAGTSDLFTFNFFKYFREGDGNLAISPADFFRRGDMNFRVHRDDWNGRNCFRVDSSLEFEGLQIEKSYWLDEGYGCLVTRCVKTTRRNGKAIAKFDATVSDWQAQGDAFFPTKIEIQQFTGEALQCKHTIVCSDLSINVPINDAELKLPPIPSGTDCRDLVKMKRYTLAPDWSRSGPETDYVVVGVADSKGNAEAIDASGGGTTTSGERRSIWQWIALGSGGLLVVALVWIAWRKRSSRSEEE